MIARLDFTRTLPCPCCHQEHEITHTYQGMDLIICDQAPRDQILFTGFGQIVAQALAETKLLDGGKFEEVLEKLREELGE